MKELLPCPKCKADEAVIFVDQDYEDIWAGNDSPERWIVICSLARGGCAKHTRPQKTRGQAAEKWNTLSRNPS